MAVTGDDKPMNDHVVYKNFPAEVLAMDEADYWLRQTLMYWGLPNALFTEPEASREPLDEPVALKVLQLADEATLGEIYRAHLRRPARWTTGQWDEVRHLAPRFHGLAPVQSVPFKENQVRLAALLVGFGEAPDLRTATDVLRLAVAMSDGDVTLRESAKLRRFSRKERRALLSMLEGASNLDEDVARRRERFKRLFRALRPGDYASRFPRAVAAYDLLYRAAPIATFEADIERLLAARDPIALERLAQRPGVMLRRLHQCLLLLGSDAAGAFARVMPKLTTMQLLRVLRHLETDHTRRFRTFPPRGNWTKLQIQEARPHRAIARKIRQALVADLETEIERRVRVNVQAVRLDPRTARIKLQTNDSDLSPYGRGTVFPIPPRVTFLRTASFWESGPTRQNLWYDNGWSFFDETWQPLGVCCWTQIAFGKAAVFSGDPTNSKDLEGRACQLIDLYLDELSGAGVRFAVWNILCYSHRAFDDAVEVHAALQWGEEPQQGKLFEPSRCQLSFPVRGKSLTKYIAYVDVIRREMIYLDANLYGRVWSAAANTKALAKIMPALVEHLDSLPSVHDLFRRVPKSDEGVCVAYDDADLMIENTAYVFRPVNQNNDYEPFDLSLLLG